MKLPVKGHIGLYRDASSGAIINCNEVEYKKYLQIKEIQLREKREIDNLKNEVENLKLLIKSLIDKDL